MANDLNGLCPALICTAGIDILRDEGIHYAQKLRTFGVPVEWKHYEGEYSTKSTSFGCKFQPLIMGF